MKTLDARLIAALVCIAALAVIALDACSPKPPAPAKHQTEAAQLAADVESGLYITGTLASLGSFEWDVAPLLNDNAMIRHNTAVAFKEHRITVDEAQRTLDATDGVRGILEMAMDACAQNQKTGKCTKNEANARHLLDQARARLSALP